MRSLNLMLNCLWLQLFTHNKKDLLYASRSNIFGYSSKRQCVVCSGQYACISRLSFKSIRIVSLSLPRHALLPLSPTNENTRSRKLRISVSSRVCLRNYSRGDNCEDELPRHSRKRGCPARSGRVFLNSHQSHYHIWLPRHKICLRPRIRRGFRIRLRKR